MSLLKAHPTIHLSPHENSGGYFLFYLLNLAYIVEHHSNHVTLESCIESHISLGSASYSVVFWQFLCIPLVVPQFDEPFAQIDYCPKCDYKVEYRRNSLIMSQIGYARLV